MQVRDIVCDMKVPITLDKSKAVNLRPLVGKKSNWQIDVRFSCFCPVIDHEFRHNIVKVDPRGDSNNIT